MEKLCFFEENYEDCVLEANIIGQGFESKVYMYGDNVLKIFCPDFQNKRSEKRINLLSKLSELDEYITLPNAGVYLDYHFIGYQMKYAGITLKRFILDNNLSENKIIELLRQIKNCLVHLHSLGFIHGDLQPKNILINDDKIKISDVNNAQFGKFKPDLLNDMTLFLSSYYGYSSLLDLHSLNYYTYLLLNLDDETMRKYIELGAEGYSYFCEHEYKNHVFMDEVCEEQMEYLINPFGNRKKALTNSKYLIDYLK